MVMMVNCRNRVPVFKNSWEKHVPVMKLEQLILPWDNGKKFIAFQILLSYILLRFYSTNISKHFALSKLKENITQLQISLAWYA